MDLMLVESPNKIKKIKAILGNDWQIIATAGHFRDLPLKQMGIDPETFALAYEYSPDKTVGENTYPGGEAVINKIRQASGQCQNIYLATDPDREGEAISWHLYECLSLADQPYQRITFDAITEKSIQAAISKPREIDFNLVRAQEARRALDRLVGYTVSELVSAKTGINLSAGRVQSVALRLVTDLENSIRHFTPVTHYGVIADFIGFQAQWDTSSLVTEDNPYILDEKIAAQVAQAKKFKVQSCTEKIRKKNAPSPFSTSLMLQAASVQLSLSPDQTSYFAQKLFEKGFITYIRTDSVNFAEEAISEIRLLAQSKDWPLPEKPNKFKSRSGAQEAHEAIRPTDFSVDRINIGSDEEKSLYQMIWQRSVASQLACAEYVEQHIDLNTLDLDEPQPFKAKSSNIVKIGWQVLWPDDDEFVMGKLPVLMEGQEIDGQCKIVEKKTIAPKRFTEASLVSKLESSGIGRPSTFASTVSNLIRKKYITVDQKRMLTPTALGESLVRLLLTCKFSFMNYDFTRDVEDKLDDIALGKTDYFSVISVLNKQLQLEVDELMKHPENNLQIHSCLACGSELKRMGGKLGKFLWSCTKEGCNQMYSDHQGKPLLGKACPECGGIIKRFARKDKKGYVWFCQEEACKKCFEDSKGNPVVPKIYDCPKCKHPLKRFARKDKSGHFWSCSDPECKLIIEDDRNKPIQLTFPPCPDCREPLHRRRSTYGLYWRCNLCKKNFKDAVIPSAAQGK